jgi:hypothetical protein
MMIMLPKPVGDSSKIYASQTKILKGRTKDWACLFKVLFKRVSTLFGLRLIEKTCQKVCSSFQNLRLGGGGA